MNDDHPPTPENDTLHADTTSVSATIPVCEHAWYRKSTISVECRLCHAGLIDMGMFEIVEEKLQIKPSETP